jgi:hypothetical protein
MSWVPQIDPLEETATPVNRTARLVLIALVGGSWNVVPLTPCRSAETAAVHLELATEPGLSLEAPSQWLRALQQLPLESLRIRTARGGDSPRLEPRGRGTASSYHVLGVIRSNNQLDLPGGKFQLEDIPGLRRWLRNVAAGSLPTQDDRSSNAFHLSDKALGELVDRLAVRVQQSTKDQPPSRVVQQIGRDVTVPLKMDRAVDDRLRSGNRVTDELSGLSSGTALAAVLRPLGLGLVPKDEAGTIRLEVTSARSSQPIWPVGWTPKKPPRETLPKLFEFLEVEIAKTPLDQALAALQPRLQVPFLIDHQALASRQIDLHQIKVNFPAKRSFYQRVLDRSLYQAGLEAALRVDEAEQPFLWISTIQVGNRE